MYRGFMYLPLSRMTLSGCSLLASPQLQQRSLQLGGGAGATTVRSDQKIEIAASGADKCLL